jgi:4-amino-4-deoxy-L-arabinose transferase-like glycosyltransferase
MGKGNGPMVGEMTEVHHDERAAWWREQELPLIVLLAFLTLCGRLDSLPLFGEEPRRALIAREMVETGDWLVPGTQRIFLPSRPPLQNWLIGLTALWSGSFDVWTVRIPSVISTILIGVLIYGYLRQLSGRLGSFGGAVSFLTMTMVMEFGRSAETEAVFSLFVAASMLLWHWAWIEKCPSWQMWSIGYGFAALGMLTKGLQAPLYFVGATGLFLLVTGNWRLLLSRGHAAGILVFILVLGAWQGPFTWHRGISDSWNIYFGDVAGRFVDRKWSVFLEHLILFPCELFLVRLMPWSILLLAFADRRVREFVGHQRDTTLFLMICILFSFISVWLPPGSKVRYYMPLFPCFAALIGIAIDRMAAIRNVSSDFGLWKNYMTLMSNLMIGSAFVIVAVSLAIPTWRFSLTIFGAIAYAAAALAFAWIARNILKNSSERAMFQGILSVAGFLALVQISLIVTVQQRRCEDISGQISKLKLQLPANSHLVSFDSIHHAFVFFYGQQIPIVPIPTRDNPGDIDFFCLHTYDCDPPLLPFKWDEVAVISCDRFKGRPIPKDRVFVGRIRPVSQVGMKSENRSVE